MRHNDYPKRVYHGNDAATVKSAAEEVHFFNVHGAELPAHLAGHAVARPPQAAAPAPDPAAKAKKSKKAAQ